MEAILRRFYALVPAIGRTPGPHPPLGSRLQGKRRGFGGGGGVAFEGRPSPGINVARGLQQYQGKGNTQMLPIRGLRRKIRGAGLDAGSGYCKKSENPIR